MLVSFAQHEDFGRQGGVVLAAIAARRLTGAVCAAIIALILSGCRQGAVPRALLAQKSEQRLAPHSAVRLVLPKGAVWAPVEGCHSRPGT